MTTASARADPTHNAHGCDGQFGLSARTSVLKSPWRAGIPMQDVSSSLRNRCCCAWTAGCGTGAMAQLSAARDLCSESAIECSATARSVGSPRGSYQRVNRCTCCIDSANRGRDLPYTSGMRMAALQHGAGGRSGTHIGPARPHRCRPLSPGLQRGCCGIAGTALNWLDTIALRIVKDRAAAKILRVE